MSVKFKSKPDWQPIENLRDERDDVTPIPRRWVVSTPLVSIAAKTLREVIERAEGGKVSEQDLLRLLAEVGIEHHENVSNVREDIFTFMDASNKRFEASLKKKELQLEKVLKIIDEKCPEYTKLCFLVGMQPKENFGCTWDDGEPMSLDEVAGTENLAGPHMVRDESKSKGLFTRATIGGAGLLTIGILSIKGEDLNHVLDKPLPAMLLFGLAYGTVNAIGHVLERKAEAAGEQLYRRGLAKPGVAVVTCWGFVAVFPLVFCVALATETLIDSFGFFKVVTDAHTNHVSGTGATQPGFAVLALMAMFVSFPILTLYSLGFHQGYYRANFLKLKAFLKGLRAAKDDPERRDTLSKLSELSGTLMPKGGQAKALEADISTLKSLIRFAETKQELRRIEDVGNIAKSADLELRQGIGLEDGPLKTVVKERLSVSKSNWFTKLFRR